MARLYVGTYTEGTSASRGIYRLEFDLESGRLSAPVLAAETKNPSFLALPSSGGFLYAVNELEEGQVSAWAVSPGDGGLTFRSRVNVGASSPCHLVLDRLGKHVLIANYGGGSVTVIALGPDGKLGERTALVQHTGSGPNRERQEKPHAHSIHLDAANRFAFVADLGLDKIFVYKFAADRGTLTPHDFPFVAMASGAGPRHLAFHPEGKRLYAINELLSTVTVLKYEPGTGTLEELQSVSTLVAPMAGNITAEVQVHPSGKFLYASNRGHDSIASFSIDSGNGRLTLLETQSLGIKTPRHFCIDPTGRFLIVANQGGDNLAVFRVDPQTGVPRPTGMSAEVPSPVCVKMA